MAGVASEGVALTFMWNTSGFAKGNYTVCSCAVPSEGEIDIADNTLTNGIIYVGIPGDIDGNHIVSMLDLYKIALRFEATRGQLNYIPECDVEDNGIINMLDLYIAATHFGQTDP